MGAPTNRISVHLCRRNDLLQVPNENHQLISWVTCQTLGVLGGFWIGNGPRLYLRHVLELSPSRSRTSNPPTISWFAILLIKSRFFVGNLPMILLDRWFIMRFGGDQIVKQTYVQRIIIILHIDVRLNIIFWKLKVTARMFCCYLASTKPRSKSCRGHGLWLFKCEISGGAVLSGFSGFVVTWNTPWVTLWWTFT